MRALVLALALDFRPTPVATVVVDALRQRGAGGVAADIAPPRLMPRNERAVAADMVDCGANEGTGVVSGSTMEVPHDIRRVVDVGVVGDDDISDDVSDMDGTDDANWWYGSSSTAICCCNLRVSATGVDV